MNFHIPNLHLFALILSLSLLIIAFTYRKKIFKKNKLFGSTIVIFLCVYTLIISIVIFIKYLHWSELQTFDINGNGIIDGTEITEEAKVALEVFSKDTGLTFAPFTGIFYASIVSVVYYLIRKVFNKI